MKSIVLRRWMLKSFFFFSKVDFSQYRNTFCHLLSAIRDTEYYGGITSPWNIDEKKSFGV